MIEDKAEVVPNFVKIKGTSLKFVKRCHLEGRRWVLTNKSLVFGDSKYVTN